MEAGCPHPAVCDFAAHVSRGGGTPPPRCEAGNFSQKKRRPAKGRRRQSVIRESNQGAYVIVRALAIASIVMVMPWV